jgi:RNA polymerase sigma-70 factor, ECF subfamily
VNRDQPPHREAPTVEDDLLARLRAGEPEAFEALVREEGPRMLAVAQRYLRDRHEAEDALQDAFMNVARSIGSFQGESRLSTWLHRVVANCALMRLRTQARRIPLAPAGAQAAPERPTKGPGGERPWAHSASELVAREDLRGCVREALESLTEADRALLTLHDIQGMTLDDLASALDMGRTTVKTHLHRARHALRQVLDERLGENHP